MLADEAGHRAVPVWLRGEPGESGLAELVELAARLDGGIITADADTDTVMFGVFLAGRGRIEMRNLELARRA